MNELDSLKALLLAAGSVAESAGTGNFIDRERRAILTKALRDFAESERDVKQARDRAAAALEELEPGLSALLPPR